MKYVSEPSKQVPVIADVDICVLGGSATGVFAAVRAAKLGATVALVERGNCFGGTATAGLVNVWHSLYNTEFDTQVIGGLTHQVLESLKQRDAVIHVGQTFNANRLNTEELKIELDALVLEANVEVFLHTFYAGPLFADGQLTGVFVENKDGRGAICARYFVDATGDGDLCRDMGYASYTGTQLQPPTTCAKIQGMREIYGEAFVTAMETFGADYGLSEDWGWSGAIPNSDDIWMHAETHVFAVDCSRAGDLTKSEMEGRRQVRAMMDLVREKIPNPPKMALVALPASIGIRETRRFNALHKVTEQELLHGYRYEDAIANGTYRVDIHHSDNPGITFRYLDGTEEVWHNRSDKTIGRWRDVSDTNPTFYQIPYRSLVPVGSKNVIMAGRMIDSDTGAFGAIRVMVNLNQTGEAAGTAAYLALKSGITFPEVDSQQLRKTLADGGSIIF